MNRIEIEGTTIVNLTNHNINLFRDNESIITIKPGLTSPVVRHKRELIKHIAGFPIHRKIPGNVENKPEKLENTYYIVSSVVAEALPDREDLLVPQTVKSNGRVYGCNGFYRIGGVK